MASPGCALTILAIITFACVAAEECYDTKFDDVDVLAILNDPKMRAEYYDCFVGTAPCITDIAKFYKGIFPEAIVTQCKKCSQVQKKNLGLTVEWYLNNDPLAWAKLIAQFLENIRKHPR